MMITKNGLRLKEYYVVGRYSWAKIYTINPISAYHCEQWCWEISPSLQTIVFSGFYSLWCSAEWSGECSDSFFQSHWVIYWDWSLKWLYRIEWPDTALMLGLVVLKASVYMLSAGRAGAAGDSSLHGVESVCTGQWVSARPHTLATNLGAEQFHHAYSSLVLELDHLFVQIHSCQLSKWQTNY